MDISLSYLYGFYTGSEKRPAVTVTDPETGKNYFDQSTYGDFMPYWRNNVAGSYTHLGHHPEQPLRRPGAPGQFLPFHRLRCKGNRRV